MINNSNDSIIQLDQQNDILTDFIRNQATVLLKAGIELEVNALLKKFKDRKLPDGRQAVCRSGYQPEREIQTGIGPVTVQVPKVRSRDGEPVTFHSALVPPFIRRTKSIEATIPWLYLKGISSGEMSNALEILLGEQAKGLSAATVSRLKDKWTEGYDQWRKKDLS